MAHRPALLVGWLAGRDVHAAIDLARVRRHDFDRQPPGERDGGGRLAHARGAGDDEKRRLVGHQWQSTLRPRLALPPAVALDAATQARTLAPFTGSPPRRTPPPPPTGSHTPLPPPPAPPPPPPAPSLLPRVCGRRPRPP